MQVYRDGNPLIKIEIDKRTTFSHKMHGEHIITAVTVTESPVGIEIGDYIEHKGQIFEVNQPIQTTKTGKFTYENTITFESYLYRLYNKVFMHQGAIEFAFLGTAQMYAQLIIDNMNEIDPGWTLGVIESTEDLPISFFAGAEGYSCRTALTLIAERFGLEYIVVNKTINLQKTAGRDTSYDFEVGMTKGLYSLTRKPLDDLKIINRIYPFGSTRNIPEGYRNGAKRLTIDGGYVERPLEAGEIRREGAIVLDDEYPNRTGTITAVSEDGLTFTDPTLFDLNGQAINGVKQQVVFKTGFLSGEEFDIAKYDDDTKEITLVPLTLENGAVIPDSTFSIGVGDTYTLVGIKMPYLYVEQAEARLLARANEILSLPKNPTYELSIDEKYVRSNTILIELGDRINIRDKDMGIDTNIRVTSISYPIVNEAEITCQVSDEIPYTTVERVLKENSETKQDIVIVNRTNSERARRNWLDWKYLQTAIYDPDGYFNPENIKPFTIETYMLSVGAKSQNFGLNNVVINPNTGGNHNTLSVSAGQLIHYEVQIEGVGYIWAMAQRTFSSLDPVKHYYLFARCSKSNLNGTWEISETPVMTNDPTYPESWNFLLGIIHPVVDGYRNHSLTNGMTLIVGDTITTGRIKSLDGLNYFDLTQNKFKLGSSNGGLDWNVTHTNALTIFGGIAQSRSGAVDFIPVERGDYNNSTPYYPGDVVKYNGSWYKYINNDVVGVIGVLPTNTAYWRLTAQKGDTGPAGAVGPRGASPVYQGEYLSAKTYYGNSQRVDVVKYGSAYYVTNPSVNTSFAGIPPTDTDYWIPFGASFDSVATALLFANRAVIENAIVRYLETDTSGKRVIINNIRTQRSTGNTVFDNNIVVKNASNQDLIEIDDDSAQSQQIFSITFNTNIPAGNIRNWDNDWSVYNGNFVSTTYSGGGSPAWATGNFKDGFPRKYTNFVNLVGGQYVYYFYYEEQGLILHGGWAEGLFPKTTIGKDVSYMRNVFAYGSQGSGYIRYTNGGSLDDDFNTDDRDIVVNPQLVPSLFSLPAWVLGGVVQTTTVQKCPFGREIRIINESTTNTLTITAPANIIHRSGTDLNEIDVQPNKTIILKVASITNSPISLSSFRWQVIGLIDN